MRKRNIFILVPFLIILVVVYIKYKEIPYEDYQNHSLKEMQKLNDTLKRITASYAKNNAIDETYQQTLYDCAGNFIYTKDENLKFSEIMQECKDDYTQKRENSYINQSWIMKDFNKWSNAYVPLEKIIKKTIKEPKSYQMLKTSYEMKFSDARPHMFVSIDFKGANIQGYMLTRNMSAKVDVKTKEIYDIK